MVKSDVDVPYWSVFLDGSDDPACRVHGDCPLGDLPALLTEQLAQKEIRWRRAEAIHTHTGTSLSFTRARS